MSLDIDVWENYFPYEPRPLQLPMIKVISKMIQKRVHLVLEAANGTGKTITALSALIPYAKRNNLKIVYLARTHTQMDRVVEELQEISKKKPVSGIALRGRGSMCLNRLVLKYAKNNKVVQDMCRQLKATKKCEYFNNMHQESRVIPVINELGRKPVTADIILDMAEAAYICPAETARLALSKVDVIACSYLYIFDPDILRSFLENIGCELEDLVIVIDECHNLPDNVRSITSDEVSTFSFNRAIREAQNNAQDGFISFFETCNDYLVELTQNEKLDREIPIDASLFLEEIYERLNNIEVDDDFFLDMVDLGNSIRTRLAKRGKEPRSSLGRIGEFFFNWFMSIGKHEFAHSIEKKQFTNSNDTFVTLRMDSLDPSVAILPILKHVNVSISMSGSLGDPEAYMLLTGIDQLNSISNILPSPYDEKNIQVLVTSELTTQYRQRSQAMWSRIVHSIVAVINNTPANTGVFAPSYSILRKLMNNGLERFSKKDIFYADSTMNSKENDLLVEKFKKMANKTGGVLVSVLGGRSSEGADFPGDLMNSVVVVGIPYAPPNCRVDAQIKYLEEKFPGRGRTLAYKIPAINRASQAAGRPVRSMEDKAFVLLVDFRFGRKDVSIHLPGWIRSSMNSVPYDPQLIGQKVENFFSYNYIE